MTAKRRYHITATTRDKRGRIIARATNSYNKTHPRQAQLAAQVDQEYKLHLHAEVAAIIKSRKNLIHSITIERYDREGRPKNAQPCPVCSHAIKLAGIKWINYTMG